MTALVSAHRGGGERARLATWEAYEDAIAIGADYAEFDVRRTRDRELVVYHDARVGGRGGSLVRDLTRSELSATVGYEVPGVLEVMKLLGGKVRGHIDLKEHGYETDVVAPALDAFGPDGFVVTSQDRMVRAVKDAFPEVRTALSLGRDAWEVPPHRFVQTRWSELHPFRRMRACGADAVAVHKHYATLGTLRSCAARGIEAMVWTVDDDRQIRRFLADPRVAVLITNRPAAALAVRARLS